MLRCRFNIHKSILIFILLLTIPVEAKEQAAKWTAYAKIEVTGESRYKTVFLEPPVYRYAQEDLSDLRITDEQGQYVPYIIQTGSEVITQKEQSYHSILIHTFKMKNDRFYDYQIIQNESDTDITGTVLRFDGADSFREDFMEPIEVFGSYDGEKWEKLGQNTIYHIEGVEKTAFGFFSPKKYSYYRIKHLGGGDPHRFSLSNLNLCLVNENLTFHYLQYQRRARLKYKIKEEHDQTVITLYNRDKLHILGIQINSEGNYKRRVAVSDLHYNDVPVTTPYIYHLEFNGQVVNNTLINLPYSQVCPILKLKIFNRSDRPLKIKEITAIYSRDKLIFAGDKGQSYRLLFGNDKALKPQYDMELYRDSVINEQQDLLSLSAIHVTKSQVKDFQQKNRKLFTLYFIIVLGVIACFLVVILMRKLSWKNSDD